MILTRWSRCFLVLLSLLFSTPALLAAPTILYDHREVGMVGWVIKDAPSAFHSTNVHRELTRDHAIGATTLRVGGDPYFMNSHASQTTMAYPLRPFEIAGDAQAQFRNFDCCPVTVFDFRQSQFYTYSDLQIAFETSQEERFILSGDIGVKKGMWALESPLESQAFLDVSVSLVRYVGGLGGLIETLFDAELTHEALLNPECLPLSQDCNTYFLPEVSLPIAFSQELAAGVYGLSVSARAVNLMNWPAAPRIIQDGSAWFDVNLSVPEPSTWALLAAALVAAALVRQRTGLVRSLSRVVGTIVGYAPNGTT